MEIIGAKPKQQKKKPYIFIGSIVVAALGWWRVIYSFHICRHLLDR